MSGESLAFNGAAARVAAAAHTSGWAVGIDDPAARRRATRAGIVGLGETYEAGHWSAERLDEALYRVFTGPAPRMSPRVRARLLLTALEQKLLNRQSGRGAFTVGVRHYDLGNDLFRVMLDESMTYTSGYWADATTLSQAQEAKLDLLCRRLALAPGQHVLDIGCGWGNFAQHAAERYGARVTGVTISREQAAFARERCAGLPVEIRLQDYRELVPECDEAFDHVVSIEMIEAVGRRNIPRFYRLIDRCLRPGGRCAIQVISSDTFSRSSDPRFDQFALWLLKYIFPRGYLPRPHELVPPRDTGLQVAHWQRFDDDYERTLLAWAARFNAGWSTIADQYDERFRRRWNFYLHGCVAAFRAGLVEVAQIAYTKRGSSA